MRRCEAASKSADIGYTNPDYVALAPYPVVDEFARPSGTNSPSDRTGQALCCFLERRADRSQEKAAIK